MKTTIITDYDFDKTTGTITFNDFVSIELSRIVSVIDVTNGTQIYSNRFRDKIGTVATNVLTLQYDTDNDLFANTDKLLIEYILENHIETVISSTTKTATDQSTTKYNYGKKGARFFINVTAASGTDETMVVKIQAKDHIGNWIDVPGATTGDITATGQTMLTLYPGMAETANSEVSVPLPREYRFVYTISGTDTPTFTFSIGVSYLD